MRLLTSSLGGAASVWVIALSEDVRPEEQPIVHVKRLHWVAEAWISASSLEEED